MSGKKLLVELMRLAKENPNSIANKLDKRTLQSQLQRFLDGYTKEPKRSTLLPVAEHYGISVEAFFDEELAETLLKQIETGEFVVKRHRATSSAPPATPTAPVAAVRSSTASALTGLAAVVEALHPNVQLAGRDVLRRWSMGETDTDSAADTLDALTHVSNNLKQADARRTTPQAASTGQVPPGLKALLADKTKKSTLENHTPPAVEPP